MPTFVPLLDRARVVEATGHTHALWSDGRSREAHAAFTLEQLDLAGPELLHYAGLVDDTGLVTAQDTGEDPDGSDGTEPSAPAVAPSPG